jgi:hypothetical protein
MRKKLILGSCAFILSLSSWLAYAQVNKDKHAHHSCAVESALFARKVSAPTIKMTMIKNEDQSFNQKSGYEKYSKKLVQIQLTNLKTGKPINPDDLKVTHTEKVHLLIIDDGLEDYSHIHPKPLNNSGLYEFEWRPQTQGNYRIWADLLPVESNTQEYVITDLVSGQPPAKINRAVTRESNVEGYTAQLSFDSENLEVGKAIMGKVSFMEYAKPLTALEPIMGSYAHIVGFSQDLKTIVHIHPMGEEPSKPTDRGGPELQFHLEPAAPGFIKLFAQVKHNGRELFFPFGIEIK